MKNKNTMNQTATEISSVQRFFWWCAGGNIFILQNYRNNWAQQTSLGVFVFIVALIATLAMTLVLAGVLEINLFASILGGIFWGFGVILALDRIFLINFRKAKKEVLKTLYRVAVTIVLSLLITDSAMLYIFEGDIQTEIAHRKVNQQKELQDNSLTQIEKTEFDKLIKDENGQQEKLDLLNQDVQEKMAIRDAEGRGDKTFQRQDGTIIQLSGKESHGSEYTNRDKEYESAKAAFEAQSDETLNGSIANNLKRIRDRKLELLNKTNSATKSLAAAQDSIRLLEMHEALLGILLSGKNKGALIFFFLLWIGLILLESAPILSKYFGEINQYDQALLSEDNKAVAVGYYEKALIEVIKNIYTNIETKAPNDLSAEEAKLRDSIVNSHLNLISSRFGQNDEKPAIGNHIKIQLANDAAFTITLSIPKDLEYKLHFDDLAAEISAIRERVRLEKGDVELVRVTNSLGNEIDRDFTPLIQQIEADRILVLHFEPAGQAQNVTD